MHEDERLTVAEPSYLLYVVQNLRRRSSFTIMHDDEHTHDDDTHSRAQTPHHVLCMFQVVPSMSSSGDVMEDQAHRLRVPPSCSFRVVTRPTAADKAEEGEAEAEEEACAADGRVPVAWGWNTLRLELEATTPPAAEAEPARYAVVLSCCESTSYGRHPVRAGTRASRNPNAKPSRTTADTRSGWVLGGGGCGCHRASLAVVQPQHRPASAHAWARDDSSRCHPAVAR
jgi:hypothetical protein